MAKTKIKICVSLDEEMAQLISASTKDAKGGFSGWVNEACKKRIASLARREKRYAEIKLKRRAA